jgi:hypothetical protein
MKVLFHFVIIFQIVFFIQFVFNNYFLTNLFNHLKTCFLNLKVYYHFLVFQFLANSFDILYEFLNVE